MLIAAAHAAHADIRSAKQEWSKRLLGPTIQAEAMAHASARRITAAATTAPSRNVVGVGVAEKIVDGQPTGIMCVKFMVRVKYPSGQIARGERLPTQVDGIPVDVEQVGEFRKFAAKKKARRRKPKLSSVTPTPAPDPRARTRPAQPGCSIGYRDPADGYVMAGTFGAVVKKGSSRYILSNNHVIADENRLPVGSPIFQQGLLDGGNPASDRIATLTQVVDLLPGVNNDIDAAIAKLDKAGIAIPDILYIGKPKGTKPAKIDMMVHKFGRTTSYRAGRITSIDTDVSVSYETGTFTFGEQIIIKGLNGQMFSDSGDSGSLILERDTNMAVGLLFAGSPAYTIANHIADVLAKFGGLRLA